MLEIRQVSLEEAQACSERIPELVDPYPVSEYHKRCKPVNHLALLAFLNGEEVGFKVGYERDGDFYSWMGGVLPQYRKRNIGIGLDEAMTQWAIAKCYKRLFFKTRNKHKGMLIMAVRQGYEIFKVDCFEDSAEHRIWFEKILPGK